MPSIVSLARFAAVALALGAISAPVAPAAAQGLAAIPSIAYPAAGTRWGCRFLASCPIESATSPTILWTGASSPRAPASSVGAAAPATVPAGLAGSPAVIIRP